MIRLAKSDKLLSSFSLVEFIKFVYVSMFGSSRTVYYRKLKLIKDKQLMNIPVYLISPDFQSNYFHISAVDLGTLRQVWVGHDGQGAGTAWKLHSVMVRDADAITRTSFLFTHGK